MSTTNGTHGATGHQTDVDLDSLYAWHVPPQSTPQSCPEALFSCTLRGKLDGIETLLTVRGQSAAEFQTNLAAVRGLLDPPAQAPQPPAVPLRASSTHEGQGQDVHWCRAHQVAMKENHKDGRTWWSHQVNGHWCRGK